MYHGIHNYVTVLLPVTLLGSFFFFFFSWSRKFKTIGHFATQVMGLRPGFLGREHRLLLTESCCSAIGVLVVCFCSEEIIQ